MMTTKITAADAGCWIDNHAGIYIGQEVIEIAESYGFEVPSEYDGDRTPDGEWYNELWDMAEYYMNDLAPNNYWFGTSEWGGDWGLWHDCEGYESEDHDNPCEYCLDSR